MKSKFPAIFLLTLFICFNVVCPAQFLEARGTTVGEPVVRPDSEKFYFPARVTSADAGYLDVSYRERDDSGNATEKSISVFTVNGQPVALYSGWELDNRISSWGDKDEEITLVGLDINGNCTFAKLKRTLSKPYCEVSFASSELGALPSLKRLDERPVQTFENGNLYTDGDYLFAKLDLFSREQFISNLKNLEKLPGPSNIVESLTLAAAINDAARAGDLRRSDKLRARFLASIKKTGFLDRFEGPQTELSWHNLVSSCSDEEILPTLKAINMVCLDPNLNVEFSEGFAGVRYSRAAYTAALECWKDDADGRAKDLAREMFANRREHGAHLAHYLSPVGEVLLKNYDFEMAWRCFLECDVRAQADNDRYTFNTMAVLRNTSNLAMAESGLGHHDSAKSLLTEAINFYKSRFDAQAQSLIEKGNCIQTKLSELELQLARVDIASNSLLEARRHLEKAQALKNIAFPPSITHIACGNDLPNANGLLPISGNEAYDLGRRIDNLFATPKIESQPGDHAQYRLVRKALDALDAGRYDVANLAVTALKKLAPARRDFANRAHEMDKFCALLNIARRMSDKELFNESNALLESLRREAVHSGNLDARLFIDAERLINNIREPKLKDVFEDKNLASGECLRQIAHLYYCAEEIDRAKLLLAYIKEKGLSSGSIEPVLFLLDEAIVVSADGNDDARALKSFAAAIRQSAPLLAERTSRRAFFAKCSLLSDNFQARKQYGSCKRVLLSACRLTTNSGYDLSSAMVQARLGELYMDTGEYHLAAGAFKKYRLLSNGMDSPSVLCENALVAEHEKDYMLAFECYAKMFDCTGVLPLSLDTRQPGWRLKYARRAFECATLAQAPGSDLFRVVCQNYTGEMESMFPKPPELVSVYTKYLSILDASDYRFAVVETALAAAKANK